MTQGIKFKMNKKNRMGISIVLGLLSIAFFVNVFFSLSNTKSTDWPGIEGKITLSEVEEISYKKNIVRKKNQIPENPIVAITRFPEIAYTFEVDGISYHSDKGPFISDTPEIIFPIGRELSIFYNPDNPQECFIDQKQGYEDLSWYTQAMSEWPSCLGKIVVSQINTISKHKRNLTHKNIEQKKRRIYAGIEYEFVVDNISYYSKRGIPFKTQTALWLVNNFPKGREVRIFFNPENKQECTLDLEENGESIQTPIPENWQKTEGHIIFSNLYTEIFKIVDPFRKEITKTPRSPLIKSNTNKPSKIERKNPKITLIKREAKLKYDYRIGTQSFSSERYSFESGNISADKLIARYPLGKKVTVFYNPEKPQQSVLVSGVKASSIVAYAVGGIVLLVLSIMGFVQVRRDKQTAN